GGSERSSDSDSDQDSGGRMAEAHHRGGLPFSNCWGGRAMSYPIAREPIFTAVPVGGGLPVRKTGAPWTASALGGEPRLPTGPLGGRLFGPVVVHRLRRGFLRGGEQAADSFEAFPEPADRTQRTRWHFHAQPSPAAPRHVFGTGEQRGPYWQPFRAGACHERAQPRHPVVVGRVVEIVRRTPLRVRFPEFGCAQIFQGAE